MMLKTRDMALITMIRRDGQSKPQKMEDFNERIAPKKQKPRKKKNVLWSEEFKENRKKLYTAMKVVFQSFKC